LVWTVFTLGVLFSFLVLAGIVVGVKAAGMKAGWGMQFSNPQFIVILAIIVTLVALNLFGVFEVTLGGRALTAASEAASRHGTGGAFMNGVLATALATPCSAPFLGAALGFAFVQPAPVIILFFVTIGLTGPSHHFVGRDNRARPGGPLSHPQLEPALAESAAETRPMDGTFQSDHGLSNACDCGLAGFADPAVLWRPVLVA
jgi:hypothetical protein